MCCIGSISHPWHEVISGLIGQGCLSDCWAFRLVVMLLSPEVSLAGGRGHGDLVAPLTVGKKPGCDMQLCPLVRSSIQTGWQRTLSQAAANTLPTSSIPTSKTTPCKLAQARDPPSTPGSDPPNMQGTQSRKGGTSSTKENHNIRI